MILDDAGHILKVAGYLVTEAKYPEPAPLCTEFGVVQNYTADSFELSDRERFYFVNTSQPVGQKYSDVLNPQTRNRLILSYLKRHYMFGSHKFQDLL